MTSRVATAASKWRIYALIPLVILALDFFQKPFLFHTLFVASTPPIKTLVDRRFEYLGRYKGHEYLVSVGSLSDDDYWKKMVQIDGHHPSIVMSHFISQANFTTTYGPVGRAIHAGISKISPSTAADFEAFLKRTADLPPGQLQTFSLRANGAEAQQAFPLDQVLVILLKARETESSYRKNVAQGLAKAFQQAADARLPALLVTTLALGPAYQPVQPLQFYDIVLGASPADIYPRQIIMSFYENWPNAYMQENIDGLNTAWSNHTQASLAERLVTPLFRLTLACWSLSLLVCSFTVPLIWVNALKISLLFIPLACANKAASFILASYGPDILLGGSVVFQIILALFLPYIVRLNPKDVFRAGGKKADA